MYCIDNPDEILIRGDYSSASATLLEIYLEFCAEWMYYDEEEEEPVEPYCVNRTEAKEVLENSNIIMLTNQIRFDSTQYRASSVVKESVVTWLPVQTDIQV